MHELLLTQGVLTTALEQANTIEANKVTKINLVIGEFANISEEALEFCFNMLSKDSIAANANLCFRHLPAKLRCCDCESIFTPAQYPWTCPQCQKRNIEIVAGRELYVEDIGVE